jgi:hypothetical protein
MSFSALPVELIDLVLELVKEQDSKYRKRVPKEHYKAKDENDWRGRGLDAMSSLNKAIRLRAIPLLFDVRSRSSHSSFVQTATAASSSQPLDFGAVQLVDLDSLPSSDIGRLSPSALLCTPDCRNFGFQRPPGIYHSCPTIEGLLKVISAIDKMAVQEVVVLAKRKLWWELSSHVRLAQDGVCKAKSSEEEEEPNRSPSPDLNELEVLRRIGFCDFLEV